MVVTVAGEKKTYDEGLTIAKLIEVEKVENPDYVTVTVNDEFVESTDFATTALKENDVVEFLYFMGGGANKWRLQMSRWSAIPGILFCRKWA